VWNRGGARGRAGWKQGAQDEASSIPWGAFVMARIGTYASHCSARVPVTCWEAENTRHSTAFWGSERWCTEWMAVPKVKVPRTRTRPNIATVRHCRIPRDMTTAIRTKAMQSSGNHGIAGIADESAGSCQGRL
jgi:hypothetical protein